MVLILVLLTFAVFLLIDHFRTTKQSGEETAVQPMKAHTSSRLPVLVSGFDVPVNLRYHLGHTWALGESPTFVRVGMDDFARKLVGRIDSITLPQRGQWIRQGQRIWTLFREGKSVDMLSPIEGIVADVNEATVRDPELVRRDPYGEGWLVTVHSPDAKINLRNLLSGDLARLWIELCAGRLRQFSPSGMGVLSQDGGTAVDDVAGSMPSEDWAALTREFFLS